MILFTIGRRITFLSHERLQEAFSFFRFFLNIMRICLVIYKYLQPKLSGTIYIFIYL